MKKYINLQFLRVAKFSPYVLALTLALLVALSLMLWGILSNNTQKEENTIFNIGVVGNTQNDFFKFGIEAFKTIDETRFSLDFIEMEEDVAKTKLKNGDISAYVVFSDHFIENALIGIIDPIKFVTTTDSNNVATLLKNELTTVIIDMVVLAQQGSYGMSDALSENGMSSIASEHLNSISLQYFDLVLNRDGPIKVNELGISSGLTISQYYICSILLVFIMIMGLPFVCIYCRKDYSLFALLKTKGVSGAAQQISELLVHFVSLVLLVFCSAFAVGLVLLFVKSSAFSFDFKTFIDFLPLLFPILIMLASFNIMVFEVASNIIGGLLMHFFGTVALCYISGCFYPIYSFPTTVQQVAKVLPVHFARQHLSSFFTGESTLASTLILLSFAALFFIISIMARRIKMIRHSGG